MKLEEAKKILEDVRGIYIEAAECGLSSGEVSVAIDTVIAELHAMQNLLDEKNEEIEHLQKENEDFKKLLEEIILSGEEKEKKPYRVGLVVGTKRERDYWKDKIREKIEELNKKEKQELKGVKGQDRYFIKQMYQTKINILYDLLKEE